jgi:hypothetical protein
MLKKGIKYDQNKDRWGLLPLEPLRLVVKVLTFGAIKYAPDNWKIVGINKQGTPSQRNYDAAQRHLAEWKLFYDKEGGEWADPESGLPHLAHAICDLLFLLWHEIKRLAYAPKR